VPEPKNPTLPKMRDWQMFPRPAGKRQHKRAVSDGRLPPRVSELIMSHVPGSPYEKLVWLQDQKVSGKLDGDDPVEVVEAEALLAMLIRLSGSKESNERRHLDELLDEALMETFPASDPVSVGNFTGTERPSRPTNRAAVELTTTRKTKGRKPQLRGRRYWLSA